jgi:hypothetical protein
MGSVRPARRFDALRALTGPGLPSRLSPDGGPPCAFAPLQRSIAAPPHRPADPKAGSSDDASSPRLPCLTTHAGTADPQNRGASGPAACRVRGLGTPIAASTTIPPDALRRRSVRRLHPSRPSPRTERVPSREPRPSWRCSRRFASPPRGACGRGRLQGFDPGASSFCHSGPRRVRRADAFLGFTPPERSPPSSWAPLWFAAPPLTRIDGVDVPVRLRHRVLRSERVGIVPLGTAGSPGVLSPCDRRGTTRVETEGGRMVSPHGSGALQRPEPIQAPSSTDPTGTFAPAGAAVLR